VLVRIPGTGAIESLNVASAAALFLHELYER
jgi:tRNA G18 (ribose-2'-O)-methylase SpoU